MITLKDGKVNHTELIELNKAEILRKEDIEFVSYVVERCMEMLNFTSDFANSLYQFNIYLEKLSGGGVSRSDQVRRMKSEEDMLKAIKIGNKAVNTANLILIQLALKEENNNNYDIIKYLETKIEDLTKSNDEVAKYICNLDLEGDLQLIGVSLVNIKESLKKVQHNMKETMRGIEEFSAKYKIYDLG